MIRHIKYPSIPQFAAVIKNIQFDTGYQGNDENGKPIYDPFANYPTINTTATEKIHGTNASVCYSNSDDFWVQNRLRIITKEEDNAHCAEHAIINKDQWLTLIKALASEYNIDLDHNVISIYFEWCGGNIQKNSAMSSITEYYAIIFRHFAVSPVIPNDKEPRWYETKIKDKWISDSKHNIVNISNYPCYDFTIDFGNPLAIQNKMIDTIDKCIEPSSPVGEQFGIRGNVGEGLVIAFIHNNILYQFKVKGDKHAAHLSMKDIKIDPVIERTLTKFLRLAESREFSYKFDDNNITITSSKNTTITVQCEQGDNPTEGNSVLSNYKVKKLKKVDDTAIQKIQDMATAVTPLWRLEQMFDLANDTINGGTPDVSNMRSFMKYLNNDIVKEESTTLMNVGLKPRDVFKSTSNIARSYFHDRLQLELFESRTKIN